MTIFVRTHSGARREEELKLGRDSEIRVWSVELDELRAIPRTPFCYWAPQSARNAFEAFASLGEQGFDTRVGLQSSDDFRWLRCWWEPCSGSRFLPYSKGGSHAPYYSDLDMSVDWSEDGRLMEVSKTERLRNGEISANNAKNWNADFYRRVGLTWPCRSDLFSARILPADVVIGNMGPGLFHDDDSLDELLAVLALVGSRPAAFLMGLQVSRIELASKYDAGLVRSIPCPPLHAQEEELSSAARRGWSIMRSLDTVSEVSHAFVVPAVLQVPDGSFGQRVVAWARRVSDVAADLTRVQFEIDELCFDLYGISEEDQQSITDGFGGSDDGEPGVEVDNAGDIESSIELDPVGLASGLVSWAVGVVVGRFDVRLATGEPEWPVEPEPFDPLPVCSPAMLVGDDGLPLTTPPDNYPIEVSSLLVDDPGHPLDLAARVRAVFEVMFGTDADRWWTDVGAVLDPKNGELSNWLHKGFFDQHLKAHSKSRRKAPILWPIGTKSGSYQVWLYAHAVTADSLFRVLNDIVNPKISVEERRFTELRQDAGPSPSASQRRAIDTQDAFVGELREFRDHLDAFAPLWAPDLNDGIVIVLAPLWELFTHHKPWSKELKTQWGKLAAGDYDWAQLAMHLWPERVIPKCAEDRSLAIAHGLEDFFWAQDNDNADKSHLRKIPATPIDQLIAERTNPATTTALQQATT